MNLALTAWSAIGALAISTGSTLATSTNSATAAAKADIVNTAVNAGSFDTLATALEAARLVDALSSEGPFTVFAPTDAAFQKLDQEALANTLEPESRSRLQQILKYHVVAGEFRAKDLVDGETLTTLSGQRIRVRFDEGDLRVNDSIITSTDVSASNGIIHVIDTVLVPTKQNIVEVAREAHNFQTLLGAARAAGLVEALSGQKSLTVFAPTDDAFARLPEGTVQRLLRPENRDALGSLLKYHIVEGAVFASDAVLAEKATTLNSEKVRFSLRGGTRFVNDSEVIANGIEASNGVVHVIDRVLVPSSLSPESSGAIRVIENAIERGAPLFNAGDAAACAAVYEVALRSLVELKGDALPAHFRSRLQTALDEASQEHNDTERAWILRRALDAAYEDLLDRRVSARMTGPAA